MVHFTESGRCLNIVDTDENNEYKGHSINQLQNSNIQLFFQM